jgi:diguanylate cyclase (GGDEF)-like protein
MSPSHEGVVIQAIGILPLALLSFLLSRSIGREHLRYWWRAWACLAVALFALYATLRSPWTRAALEPVCFFGELLFAGLIVAGCRNLSTGARLTRSEGWLLAPAALLALALTYAPAEFTVRFIPQAALLSALFWAGSSYVGWAPDAGRRRIGRPLLSASLVALVLWFLQYVPVLAWAAGTGSRLPAAYAAYTPLFDLLLETLLGFGTLIVVMEDEHRELETANASLRAARDQIEARARVDPLTDSLTRHAFYSMVEGRRTNRDPGGCVALLDVDALKPINDTFGHAAGDAAIRAVARAIREVVRADDLVFRWGGDEFLAVLFGVSEDDARRRLDGLHHDLARVAIPGSAKPLPVTASAGVAAFDTLTDLERAIEVADDRMYQYKQRRRATGKARRGG